MRANQSPEQALGARCAHDVVAADDAKYIIAVARGLVDKLDGIAPMSLRTIRLFAIARSRRLTWAARVRVVTERPLHSRP